MLCFILNGEALTDETKKEEITSNNSEITLKQYSDLLEMEYKDFQSLLDAAEIEVSDSSAVFTKDNQMKLAQFLQKRQPLLFQTKGFFSHHNTFQHLGLNLF